MVAGRQRLTPKGQLVPRTETLGKFGERVGRLLYDDSFAVLSSLMHSDACFSEHAVGDDEELVTIVREQILGGLSRGMITAGASFDVDSLHRRRARFAVIEEDNEEEDLTSICAWTIFRDFWSDPAISKEISWAHSKVVISSSLLISTESSRRSAADLYSDIPDFISAQICIIAPDAALRNVTFFEPLPSPSSLADYAKFISLPINAAIAAAWRLICIKNLDFHHGQLKNIVEEVDRFLIKNNYKSNSSNLTDHPTHATLEAIVGKIKQQFELFKNDQSRDHAEVPVLFNSTPADRARRRPGLF